MSLTHPSPWLNVCSIQSVHLPPLCSVPILVASSLCPSSLSTVTAPDSSTNCPLLTLTMSSYTAQCNALSAMTLLKNYIDSFLRGENLAPNSVTSTLSPIRLGFTAHSVRLETKSQKRQATYHVRSLT